MQIALVLAITAGALGLFLWNKLRVDVVGLFVMVALVLTGLVTPAEGISGFANEALVTVGAMFVLSAGLLRTGAVDALGRLLGRVARESELRLLLAGICVVVPLSAVINNTPVIAVMVPVMLGLSRKIGAAPSRLLMPLSFASQLGGTLTLVGTSTNLLVAGMALELGLPRLGLFDITGPGFVLMVAGVLYLLTIGRVLTPVRRGAQDLLQTYELREYLSALRVPEDSDLAGQSLGELEFGTRFGLQVLAVDRASRRLRPGPQTVLRVGDLLLVEGKVQDIARVREQVGLELLEPVARAPWAPQQLERAAEEGAEPAADEQQLLPEEWAELIVPPRSRLIGRTLAGAGLRERFGATVVGYLHEGASQLERLARVRLSAGDLLLVQARPEDLQRIHAGRDLTLLGALELPLRRTRRMWLAILVMGGVLALSATGVLPILVAALLGCCAMFVTGCLRPDEAYEEIDWMVLVMIGTLLPLGLAMERSGAARWVAELLLPVASPFGPYAVLFCLYLSTSLLTELISNNAAAIVLVPIAAATAGSLGISPMPFLIAVMLAASNSFMTPVGYQTNTFVFGPGGYRFSDFLRVGGPLNLILSLLATFAIPFFFPF